MAIPGFVPPLLAPNGQRWNFLIVNADDWFQDVLKSMPTFNSKWASMGTWYPNASVNTPLCFCGRAATYTGWRVERHDAVDNGSGTRFTASGGLANVIPAVLKRIGYYNGFVGKIFNGLGESGNGGWGSLPWFMPGVDYMAGQWDTPNYFNWKELKTDGTTITHGTNDTNDASTDYAVDVERNRVISFFDSVPANKPWSLIWASKGTHQDAGGSAIPPARYASAAVTLTEDASFGLDLMTVGHGDWVHQVGTYPWGPSDAAQARSDHTAALRVALAQDEAFDTVFTSLQTRGWLQNTIIVLKCDNAHSGGEGCFSAKGVPHRSATNAVQWIFVPGIAGGTCYAPVSDIDVAPTVYELAGARPMRPSHGMSMVPVFLDKSHTFRLAAPISNPEKDSPVFSAAMFGGNPGRMRFRILSTSTKGAGQVGGYVDAPMTKNVMLPGDDLTLAALEALRS